MLTIKEPRAPEFKKCNGSLMTGAGIKTRQFAQAKTPRKYIDPSMFLIERQNYEGITKHGLKNQYSYKQSINVGVFGVTVKALLKYAFRFGCTLFYMQSKVLNFNRALTNLYSILL